jgi:uncharacterized protein YjbI with pentapeptide repeats
MINLRGANLRKVNLSSVDLTRATLVEADLRNACCYKTDLDEALLTGAKVQGVDFRSAIISECMADGIQYSRRRLHDRCLGIRGAESCHGSPIFRRDILDQDIIDARRAAWRRDPLKRVFLLWPWAAIDYGRSLWRVLAIAALIITAFGLSYPALEANGHVHYVEHAGVDNAFRPFYVAALAFSTLGFTDVVAAASLQGQIALLANVLLGYLTLGLLLAILANGVARRA